MISDFWTATSLAVVLVELWVIAWIRARYLAKFLRAAFEVGGLIVFGAGVLIGNA